MVNSTFELNWTIFSCMYTRHRDGNSSRHGQLLDQRRLTHGECGRLLQPQSCLLCQGGGRAHRDQGDHIVGNYKINQLKENVTTIQFIIYDYYQVSCNEGGCGACIVTVDKGDGQPVRSVNAVRV